MQTTHTQDVARHYTRRHEQRGDLFGKQPFANYGYWTRPGMTMEEAAEALTLLVASACELSPQDRLLDVGCGYGAGAVSCARQFQPQSIVGIDVTELRLEYGRNYVREQGFADRIELRMGDATRMDFGDGSFDKLVSVECAFHFDTRADFLREAARVLCPGGILALTDLIPKRGIDPSAYLRGATAVGTGVCLDNRANAYDADTYAAHLGAAGFTDIRIESIIDRTRIPFIDAFERAGERLQGQRAVEVRNSVARLRGLVAAGEDYVLVVARKA
ncbi:class I SAM-dependent methyltransferase [Solimonas sp. K1W22B-7]|uniref:SAM-dependent methyltransferase n=1 Tax=Solimonas sp. K1W22B-7 TaxID=2303331 RepID=UPI000E332E7F|nr:class I SAM-dependent methyltransferase [Solimonas sp. K1W22B-7]AXQ28358.1 class I SAM-dependent methyltransferase [Solimonas sp. K1W22B-7]